MATSIGRKFQCLKYFLMSSNAFGLMIGIFLVLFGMAYQDQTFPGGYSGKETSGIAGVFIFITLVGYCGVSIMIHFLPVSIPPPDLSFYLNTSFVLFLFGFFSILFFSFILLFYSLLFSFSLPHLQYTL